jgi:TPR repeat protein
MYQFYLKPVITDKMRTLCVIVTDNMNHDGTVELDSFQKSYNHNVFRLGLCYYYGEEIAANKEKGLVLIKEAAGMGSNSAHEWLAYPHWRKTWWG